MMTCSTLKPAGAGADGEGINFVMKDIKSAGSASVGVSGCGGGGGDVDADSGSGGGADGGGAGAGFSFASEGNTCFINAFVCVCAWVCVRVCEGA